MRIVYFCSGEIGLPVLEALLKHDRHRVVAVVTQPDRPAGRHHETRPAAVKAMAAGAGLPVLQPERIRRDGEAIEALRAFSADIFVVFAYGQILPQSVLDLPRVACLNLHASLLPRWRGAAPIQAAIAAGDRETGLTVMYMDAGLDTGDMLLVHPLRIRRRETGGSLHDRLAALAPEVLLQALDMLGTGRALRTRQISALASYAPKLDRESGRIDWSRSCGEIERHIRAMNPWPGGFSTLPNPPRKLKVFSAIQIRKERRGQPGEVLRADERGLLVATGVGGLLLRDVQLEGKKRLPAGEFLRGNRLPPGTVLGRGDAGASSGDRDMDSKINQLPAPNA